MVKESKAKKAIIIGATSGIGLDMAKFFSMDGYVLGITGRRKHLLEQLKEELAGECHIKSFDVSDDSAGEELEALIDEMGGMDLIIINAGIGFVDKKLPWEKDKITIDTNVLGFTAMANTAYRYFLKKGTGHLVGIPSIAALRGGPAPAYNASKAYVSNYLQGLRSITARNKTKIVITDIQPGFIDTAMAQGGGLFWVASQQEAASQIFTAIKKKRKHAYISKRWRLIAWVLKIVPDFLYHKM